MALSSPLSAPPDVQLARIQRAYSLVVFLNWFAAILPGGVIVLFAQSRGLTLSDIGLYVSIYAATAALLELPTGNLADLVGRKRVSLVGSGLAIVAKLVLLFAFSLPAFVGYAVVWGLARALGSGALEAWFVSSMRQVEPGVDLQPRLARVNSVELCALGTGALIGAALPAWWGAAVPPGVISPLAFTVLISLVLHLVTLIVTWRVIHEAPPPRGSVLTALWAGMVSLPARLRGGGRTVRYDAFLPWLLLLEVLTGLMLAASETYWQPFFAGRLALGGSKTTVFGVLLAGCFLAGMLGNLSAGPLLRLAGRRIERLGGITQAIQAAALITLAWQGSVWPAALLLWLTYFARSAFSSSFLALYNDRISDGQRSLMLSVLSMALFVGVSLGNMMLGAISGRWSISWAWTLTGSVLMLSTGIFSRLRSRHEPG